MSDFDSEDIEIMARADAAFAGRDFDGLSNADQRRYRERAQFMLEAMIDQRLGVAVGERLKRHVRSGGAA